MRLEKMRHSVAESCCASTTPVTVLFTSKVPSTPAEASPYRLYPMVKVLSRVPNIAKIMMDTKLSKKASSYSARAESRMMGGSRNSKKSWAVNWGKGFCPSLIISSRMT